MNRLFLTSLGVMGLLISTGCNRESNPPAAQQNLDQPAATAASPNTAAPSTAPGTYRADQLTPQPVTPGAGMAGVPTPAAPQPGPAPELRPRSGAAAARSTAAEDRPRTVTKTRSKKKSAAIIGGSAATGAAIGAIAGGGKGAAIGGIAGGVGGLIYDRKTAKKTEPVR